MAEIGSITGNVVQAYFVTPKLIGAGYMCPENRIYVIWKYNKNDTGYIIYRDGVEIANDIIPTTTEFIKIKDLDLKDVENIDEKVFDITTSSINDSGHMFSHTDRCTNLFAEEKNRLMYVDNDIKKFKQYTYKVVAYRELEDGTYILSGDSNEITTKTI